MPEPTHLPQGQAGGRSSPRQKAEGRWCINIPGPSSFRWNNSEVCPLLSLTLPEWARALIIHSRSLLHNSLSWLLSLSFPVSLPHAPTSVSRIHFKSLYALKFLSQGLLFGKLHLRPDGVVGGKSLDVVASRHLFLNPSLRGSEQLII